MDKAEGNDDKIAMLILSFHKLGERDGERDSEKENDKNGEAQE